MWNLEGLYFGPTALLPTLQLLASVDICCQGQSSSRHEGNELLWQKLAIKHLTVLFSFSRVFQDEVEGCRVGSSSHR